MTQTEGIQGPLEGRGAQRPQFRGAVTVLLLSGMIVAATHGAGFSRPSKNPKPKSKPSPAVAAARGIAPGGSSGGTSPRTNPVSNGSERSSVSGSLAPDEADRTCPSGMIEIRADYCPAAQQVCRRFLGPASHDRCAEFFSTSRCVGAPVSEHYCIDEFEYPNLPGVIPLVNVAWDGAQELCESSGKRLCSNAEWTLACEGKEGFPYPYGHERDTRKCNIDKSYIVPNDDAYANPSTRDQESARLSQAEPSGYRTECVSSFGVHDLTGNVDEWVVNEEGSTDRRPYVSGLKGGYWGPVRSRCRPMTVDHDQWHIGYQIGFRCCADAPDHDGDGGEASSSRSDTNAVGVLPTSAP